MSKLNAESQKLLETFKNEIEELCSSQSELDHCIQEDFHPETILDAETDRRRCKDSLISSFLSILLENMKPKAE